MLLPRRRIQYSNGKHFFEINIVYYRTPQLYNVIDSITIKDHSGVITNNFDIFMDSPDFYPMWYDDGYGDYVETLAEFNMINKNDNIFYWKNGRVKNFSTDDYNNIDTRGVSIGYKVRVLNQNDCGIVKPDMENNIYDIKMHISDASGLDMDSCVFEIKYEYIGLNTDTDFCFIENNFIASYEEDWYGEKSYCTFDVAYLYPSQLHIFVSYAAIDYDDSIIYSDTISGYTQYGNSNTTVPLIPRTGYITRYLGTDVYENNVRIYDFVDVNSFIYTFG